MRHPQSPQSLSDQAARLMLNAPISLNRKSVPAPLRLPNKMTCLTISEGFVINKRLKNPSDTF